MIRTLIAVFTLILVTPLQADDTVQNLQDVSVTIRSGFGQGSGVLFTRGDQTYVWTAGHVIDNLRKTRGVVVNGVTNTVVEFEDAELVREFRENGRRIGEEKMDCQVIRYSGPKYGEDLALLRVRKRNYTTASTTFYTGDIPDVGTELYHVGSLHGQFGSNSLTTGVVSQIGRVLDLGANGVVFDQVSTPGFPGSSGGGVFRKDDGTYVGMLVRGAGENFCLIVPVRRMRAWAKEANVEWAMDPNVPMPSKEELDTLPIEDAGAQLSHKTFSKESLKYPFLPEFSIIVQRK